MDFPTFGTVLVHGVAFDARRGIGSGFRPARAHEAEAYVAMRPSAFLALSTPLPAPRPSLGWLSGRIADGAAICPAALRVWLPPSGVPAVLAHDGRHRMTALLAALGDVEVPVRLAVADHDDDDLTPAVMAALRSGMRSQRGGPFRVGPLFGRSSAEEDGIVAFGLPPPSRPARKALPFLAAFGYHFPAARRHAWRKTMMKLFVAAIAVPLSLAAASAHAQGQHKPSPEAVCKAAIAAIMGRDPATIKATRGVDGVVETSYVRPGDGTRWSQRCRLEGDKVVWASDTGRWRDSPADEVITFSVGPDRSVTIKQTYQDGSASEETFPAKKL